MNKKKLALIIGGARGIGLTISSELRKKDYELLIFDKSALNITKAREFIGDDGSTHYFCFDLLNQSLTEENWRMRSKHLVVRVFLLIMLDIETLKM